MWVGCAGLAVLAAERGGKAIGVGQASKPATGGRRWAVIVGVNDYQNVPKLRYSVADARLLHILRSRLGWTDRPYERAAGFGVLLSPKLSE